LWALKYSWPRNVSLADTFPRVEGGDNTILGQDAGSQKGRGRPILVHSQGQQRFIRALLPVRLEERTIKEMRKRKRKGDSERNRAEGGKKE
jgi:hypothetical protein